MTRIRRSSESAVDGKSGVRRSRAFRLARSGLAACLLLLAAARLGGSYAALDLINLAAPPLAAASVLIAAILLFRARSWAGRVLLCVCLVPGVLLLLPDPARPAGCSAASQRLRVAWINAHHPLQPDRIAAWLEAEQPQVVGVAELKRDLPLRKVLQERYPHWRSCLGNGRCSTLLYSRIEPAGQTSLANGDPENRRALSGVSMAFASGLKDAAPDAGEPFQILAVHLSRPLPLGRQRQELLELDRHLRNSSGVILMGDLNMSPRMRLLHDFAARNGLRITRTARPTWPATIDGYSLPPLWQIDHLLVGRTWHVTAIRTSPDLGSDHKGFVADLCRDGA